MIARLHNARCARLGKVGLVPIHHDGLMIYVMYVCTFDYVEVSSLVLMGTIMMHKTERLVFQKTKLLSKVRFCDSRYVRQVNHKITS